MINNCRSKVSVNHISSSIEIQRRRGLFQGSILSPFLFNIVIDSLAYSIFDACTRLRFLFFADDIVLKASSWESLQCALNICYEWSSETKLEWGIRKCAVVSSLEHFPLVLGEEIIPTADEYKYLGLPTTARGVNWRSYLKHITYKLSRFLQATQDRKVIWDFRTRLVIYRSFARPIIEYCLPLLVKWIKKQPDKDKLWEILLQSHKDGVEWIFDRTRAIKCLENISGLGSFSFRSDQLEASLAIHLSNLEPSNPLLRYKENHFISSDKNFILSNCFNSGFLKEWRRYKSENKDGRFQLSYPGWVRRKKLESLTESTTGVLTQYVLNRCRTRSLMDTFLYLPLTDSGKILKWRCNSSFIRGTCPECLQPFNRAHLIRCGLLQLVSSDHLQIYQLDAFIHDLKKLRDTGITGDGYTPLDFYINDQNYQSFLDLYDQLRSLIMPD
jgi:hypothetical protein